MLARIWYRATIIAIVFIPGLLMQTLWPIIPYKNWEDLSEIGYSWLMSARLTPELSPSRVVIVEIDEKTRDQLGWPIDRKYYSEMLQKLEKFGRPWVLSLIHMQNLTSTSSAASHASQAHVVQAIASYGRYIGTGLGIKLGEELSDNEEQVLMPRIIMSRLGVHKVSSYLPFYFREPDDVVAAQAKFGFYQFGPEATVRCMPMFEAEEADPGRFVIPSSLMWTTGFTLGRQIITTGGAKWPWTGEHVPTSLSGRTLFAQKHCLADIHAPTRKYLETRHIDKISFVDLLHATNLAWQDKAVILGVDDMKKFKGPGEDKNDDGIVPEHLLVARFLDGLLTGDTVRRSPLRSYPILDVLPLVIAAGLIILAFFMSVGKLAVVSFAFALCLALVGMANLFWRLTYLLPVQAFLACCATGLGCCGLLLYIKYYGLRRQYIFARKLREGLWRACHLDEISQICREACDTEFASVDLRLDGADKSLYAAADDPATAMSLLAKTIAAPTGNEGAEADTFLPAEAESKTIFAAKLSFAMIECTMTIVVEGKRLGEVALLVNIQSWQQQYVRQQLETLEKEITQAWSRVDYLVHQKLRDYQFLMQKTRSQIIEKFLTRQLVERFSDGLTMEENLKQILTPKIANVVLLQADIRGYSGLFDKSDPMVIAELLRTYYTRVVDAAAIVAQVKLIGDCIFLFIEESAKQINMSAADIALYLACFLVRDTLHQNQINATQGKPQINFGIALHYGEAIVGNLSSANCIDYTVVGPNVNMVARLEEVTKHPKVKEVIGPNAILLSMEFTKTLRKYRGQVHNLIQLPELEVTVRSFPHVKSLHFLRAEAALTLSSDGEPPADLPQVA